MKMPRGRSKSGVKLRRVTEAEGAHLEGACAELTARLGEGMS